MADTVKLDISIEIKAAGVVDTEITVEDWNAMTDRDRSILVREAWDNMAQQDNGGIQVITPGAEEV